MDYLRPCLNCRMFHWGQCNYEVRVCWTCGGNGHIQRHCPRRQRRGTLRGKPLPGSNKWCQALGIDEDPRLKSNIRSTLKEFPGATIYLNDECIYRGVQTYFYRQTLPQGRDLAERLTRPARAAVLLRSRSRSPSRERAIKRSRSPLGRYSRDYSPLPAIEAPRYQEWRSVSPVINLSSDGNIISLPQPSQAENIAQLRTLPIPSSGQLLPAKPQKVISNPAPPSRSALASCSGNIPLRSSVDLSQNEKAANQNPPAKAAQMPDPHFVLGISKGAGEAECVHLIKEIVFRAKTNRFMGWYRILAAYQQHMWEIELERISDGENDSKDKLALNRWDESIKILVTAKNQLLGS